jgi:hypothetical protein
MVFHDADLVPLLIAENYVNHNPNIAGNNPQMVRGCRGWGVGAAGGGRRRTHSITYQHPLRHTNTT